MPNEYQTRSLSISEDDRNHSQLVVVESEVKGPAQEQKSLLPVTVFQSLRRYSRYTLPAGVLLALLLSALGANLTVPEHRAVAYLRVKVEAKPLAFETADHPGMKSTFDLYKNTQMQLITTPFVLNAALRDDEVRNLPLVANKTEPVVWMKENVDAEFQADGEIMEVGFTSSDPRASVMLVNAIVSAYLEEVVNSERMTRFQRLENLQAVRATSEDQMRSKQQELRFLAEALGTSDSESLTVAQQSAIQQFGLMQEKLSEVQFELMKAQGELDIALELNELRNTESATTQDTAEDVSPKHTLTLATLPLHRELMSLQREIVEVELQLREGAENFGTSHPNVASRRRSLEAKKLGLSHEVESLAAQLAAIEETSTQSGIGEHSETVGLAFLDKRVKVLQSQEKAIQEKVAELEAGTKTLGRSSIDVLIMRSEIQSLDDVLSSLSEEIERTKIELKTESRITLVNDAKWAGAASQKKRYFTLAALGLIGFFVPVALCVGYDVSRRRIDSPDMLDGSLTATRLGSIPQVAPKYLMNDAFPITGEVVDPSELPPESRSLSEAIRSTSTLVSMLFQKADKRVIMIGSAIASEGKSTMSVQLAKTLAQSSLRVLLVDFDLRRPSIERYLGLDRSLGVSDVLSGRCHWREAVHRVGSINVLTSGPANDDMTRYESNGKLEEFFKELKQEFDLIIVDSSPVLAVVDACLVGTHCDGAIMTVRRDVSRVPPFRNACTELNHYGVDILGTVFIGIHENLGYHGYGYDYDYHRQEPAVNAKKPAPR